jgi:putative component of membrane protein insertase Oxa1/YidC/SpoIIIJ protein YidD
LEEEIGLFVVTCANFKIPLEEEIGLFVVACANFYRLCLCGSFFDSSTGRPKKSIKVPNLTI